MRGLEALPAAIAELNLTPKQTRFLALLAERPGEPRRRDELEREIFGRRRSSPTALNWIANTVGAKLRRLGFEVATVPPHRGGGGFFIRPCPDDRRPARFEGDDGAIEIDPPSPEAAPALDGRWDDDEWVAA